MRDVVEKILDDKLVLDGTFLDPVNKISRTPFLGLNGAGISVLRELSVPKVVLSKCEKGRKE